MGAGIRDERATARRVAVVYAVTLGALVVAGAAMLVADGGAGRPENVRIPSVPLELLDRAQFLVLALLAAFLLPRQPRNRFVWVLLVAGVGFPLWDVVESYGRWRLQGGRPADAVVAAWISNWVWVLTAPLTGLLFVLFPDGRLPSRRWRPVAWLSIGAATGLGLAAMVIPGPLDVFPEIANPLGLPVDPDLVMTVFYAFFPLQMLAVVGGAVSVLFRYRRASTVERQQLKWFAASAMVFIVFSVTGPLGIGSELQRAVLELLVTLQLTAAIGIAITRYRLYEIDRLVSRTIAYGTTVGILLGVYAVSTLALGALARELTGSDGSLVVALSTLAVAGLFRPVTRRVRATVERRFDRSAYDAQLAVDGFVRELRDEVSLDAIVGGVEATVARTLSPRSVGLVLVDTRHAAAVARVPRGAQE